MEPPERKFTMAHSATVAALPVLAAYDAEALPTEATAFACTAGVRAGGWRAVSVHGSILGDAAVDALSARLAQRTHAAACEDDQRRSQQPNGPPPNGKLGGGGGLPLPEMPYTSSLTLTHEASGVTLRFGENK